VAGSRRKALVGRQPGLVRSRYRKRPFDVLGLLAHREQELVHLGGLIRELLPVRMGAVHTPGTTLEPRDAVGLSVRPNANVYRGPRLIRDKDRKAEEICFIATDSPGEGKAESVEGLEAPLLWVRSAEHARYEALESTLQALESVAVCYRLTVGDPAHNRSKGACCCLFGPIPRHRVPPSIYFTCERSSPGTCARCAAGPRALRNRMQTAQADAHSPRSPPAA